MNITLIKSGYITKTASVYDNKEILAKDGSVNNLTLSRDQPGVYPINNDVPFVGAENTFNFGGNGGYYTIASNSVLGFSTGEFTIEGFFKINTSFTGNKVFFDFRPTQSLVFGFSSLKPYFFNGSDRTSTTALTVGTWHHVVWQRRAGNFEMYLDGTSIFTPLAGSQGTASAPLWLGVGDNGTFGWPMYASNIRIVKGSAVYSGNFVKPSTNLTAITNTSLLLTAPAFGGVKVQG